jgi:hypothetical protein
MTVPVEVAKGKIYLTRGHDSHQVDLRGGNINIDVDVRWSSV